MATVERVKAQRRAQLQRLQGNIAGAGGVPAAPPPNTTAVASKRAAHSSLSLQVRRTQPTAGHSPPPAHRQHTGPPGPPTRRFRPRSWWPRRGKPRRRCRRPARLLAWRCSSS